VVLGPISTTSAPLRFSIQRTVPTLPAGTTCIEDDVAFQSSGCVDTTNPKTIQFGDDQLDSTGKANLLVVAGSSAGVLGYGWAPEITPGAGVAVAVPAWLPPVNRPLTLSPVAQSVGVTPAIGASGIIYPANDAFRFVSPTDQLQTSLLVPPAGVGDEGVVIFRSILGIVITDSSTFDAATAFLPAATDLVFTPIATIGNTSESLSYSLQGATGVVLTENWLDGGVDNRTIVVAPATGEMVIPDLEGLMIPMRPGVTVDVTLWGFDVTGMTDAQFRQRARGFLRAVSPGGLQPFPDPGPGKKFRATSATTTR